MCSKVWAENYEEVKANRDKMMEGMPKGMRSMMSDDLTPVDLNLAFVPVDKLKSNNLAQAAHTERERFGLLNPGEEV